MKAFKLLGASLFFLLASGLSFGQAISSDGIYVNEEIGVRSTFGNAWRVITTREQAPELLKPNFPANKGPNDSPLFVALHDNQQLFSRLLVDRFFGDLEGYLKVLGAALPAQGVRILAARMAEDGSFFQIDYLQPSVGLKFRERVSESHDGRILRLGFWTAQALFDQYSAQMETIFSTTELLALAEGEQQWLSSWADAESRLPQENVEGIEIAGMANEAEEALVCQDSASSLMWHVSGNNSEIYLFGSIHVGKASFYPLPELIENRFRDAEHLVFEIDPVAASSPETLQLMQSRGMLPEGQRLDQVLSPEVFAQLRNVLQGIGMPVEAFMQMQPWLITTALTGMQMNALGFSPQYGLESYFVSSKPANAEILELETLEDQINALTSLNAETFLSYTLSEFDGGKEEINRLINAWQCADKAELESMLFESFQAEQVQDPAFAELEKTLFHDRNVTMTEGVVSFLEEGSDDYFVVVGTAHLLGEDSVIAMLREKGYQVDAISLE